jgi:hypothetical protein
MGTKKEARVFISVDGTRFAMPRNPTINNWGGTMRETDEDTDTPGIFSERTESGRITFQVLVTADSPTPAAFKRFSDVTVSWESDVAGKSCVLRNAYCESATEQTDGSFTVVMGGPKVESV